MSSLLTRWGDTVGGFISSATPLISDLIRVVGQYIAPLEHQWACIPNDLRRSKLNITCEFCEFCDHGETSTTFPNCGCFSTRMQHTCSIYTMRESGSTRFRVHLTAAQFWVGIIWTSMPTLDTIFPPITSDNPDDFPDTMVRIRDIGLGGFLLNRHGHILQIFPTARCVTIGSVWPSSSSENYKEFEKISHPNLISCFIEISIVDNIFRLNAIYYGETIKWLTEPFEFPMIPSENIRPFIQMSDSRAMPDVERFDHKKITARIETLLDHDLRFPL